MTVGSDMKQCLANVKSIEATLSMMAIQSRDEETKRLFHEEMLVIEEIKQDMFKRVGVIEREERQFKGF